MNCMKCGREIDAGQVFCESCLAEMEKFPVKPGTVIQLPKRTEYQPPRRATRRKASLSAEEQLARLKKKYHRLVATLVVTLILMASLAVAAGFVINKLGMQTLVGKNYSTVVSTAPTETEAPAEGTEAK